MRKTENSREHVPHGKSCQRHELESTFHSETSERSLFVLEDISHLCMFGVMDPRSRREQTCSRTGERTHECILEFVSLAHGTQAVIRGVESDAVKRPEAYPVEDAKMDLAGTAIPDDEFHEETQLEESKVSEEVTNAIRLAIMRDHKIPEHPSKELLCRALRLGGANKIAVACEAS